MQKINLIVECLGCNTKHKISVNDKTEIYCELCGCIFNIDRSGKTEKSKLDHRFDLCSSEINERAGPGVKIGQFVWGRKYKGD